MLVNGLEWDGFFFGGGGVVVSACQGYIGVSDGFSSRPRAVGVSAQCWFLRFGAWWCGVLWWLGPGVGSLGLQTTCVSLPHCPFPPLASCLPSACGGCRVLCSFAPPARVTFLVYGSGGHVLFRLEG